jgi:hypothetical protein
MSKSSFSFINYSVLDRIKVLAPLIRREKNTVRTGMSGTRGHADITITLKICIRELPSSNLGRETGYPV